MRHIVDIERRRYRFNYRVASGIHIRRPECAVVAFAKFCFGDIVFCKKISKRHTEELVFFRVILNAVNSRYEFAILLLESVEDYIRRNCFIVYIYVGKNYVIANFSVSVNVGNFKVAILADLCAA